jgi:hypothetical protein
MVSCQSDFYYLGANEHVRNPYPTAQAENNIDDMTGLGVQIHL